MRRTFDESVEEEEDDDAGDGIEEEAGLGSIDERGNVIGQPKGKR